MRKTILTFGLISGAIAAVLMLATVPFMHRSGVEKYGYLIGYTGMVLSFLLVFFGIRSYRDNVNNGEIGFGKAIAVGIAITLISSICYVATWEIVYFNFLGPGFMDKYVANVIENTKASGASAQAVQAKAEQMKQLMQLYQNPFFNSLMTFIEPFPVGLVITLISAAILRKRQQSRPADTQMAAHG
jgi:hypothetical protein